MGIKEHFYEAKKTQRIKKHKSDKFDICFLKIVYNIVQRFNSYRNLMKFLSNIGTNMKKRLMQK